MVNPKPKGKPIYIRVDDQADLKWLEKLCDNWLARDPNDERLLINFAHIYNWKNYINNNVVTSKEVYTEAEAPDAILPKEVLVKHVPKPPPPKKRGRPAKKTSKMSAKILPKKSKDIEIFTCKDHPKYEGIKQRPRVDCDGCWDLYAKFNKDKAVPMRAAFNSKRKLSQ